MDDIVSKRLALTTTEELMLFFAAHPHETYTAFQAYNQATSHQSSRVALKECYRLLALGLVKPVIGCSIPRFMSLSNKTTVCFDVDYVREEPDIYNIQLFFTASDTLINMQNTGELLATIEGKRKFKRTNIRARVLAYLETKLGKSVNVAYLKQELYTSYGWRQFGCLLQELHKAGFVVLSGAYLDSRPTKWRMKYWRVALGSQGWLTQCEQAHAYEDGLQSRSDCSRLFG